MKKLLLLFGFLTLLFVGTPTALAVEKSYTIIFKTAANNNQSDATQASDIITDESIKYISGISATKASAGKEGLKLGSGSSNGTLTLILSKEACVIPTSIVISAKAYNNEQSKIKYNGKAPSEEGFLTSNFKDYTWNPLALTEITEIKISTSPTRAFIKSVTVYYDDGQGGGEPEPTPVAPNAPTFSIAEGTYTEAQTVEISAESDAVIYYTLDDSEPSASSTPYNGSITIAETTTLKAIAVRDNLSSPVTTATYIITTSVDPTPGDEPQTLFHETFGNNSSSARVWKDEYSVKSGVQSVYENVAYSITNAKQSKNTVGHVQSALIQTTKNMDAIFEAGPFDLSSATNVSLSYYWKASSIKETYNTKIYYSTNGGLEYTELTHSATGATTFEEIKVSVPKPLTNNTYFKVIFNTSNTQAAIDEFDIYGVLTTPDVSKLNYANIEQLNNIPNGTLVEISDAYVAEIEGQKTLVVYDMATGNITTKYPIAIDETADNSFVENRIHNVIGYVAKDGESISLTNAVITDCGDPSLAIEVAPTMAFEENGMETENNYQFIHKPVTITHPFIGDGFANATIYYTRDGSMPDIANAREENASATEARSRAEGDTENVFNTTLDAGTFIYSGPFYAVHPDNWAAMEYGKSIQIKAMAAPAMPGAALWTVSAVAESAPVHVTTGIIDITTPDADATYYTIQGIRVTNPTAGNIYIRVADGRATKVRF